MNKAFIVCGSPAVGKSTYAAQLAKKHRAALIDIDTCTEQLVKTALTISGHSPDDRDSPYFKTNLREPIYQTLFNIAAENLACMNVVIVGPFTKEIRDPVWPEKLIQILNAVVEIHYLSCNPEERRIRMESRNNPRDFEKLKDWDNHIKYFSDESPPLFEHVYVNTSEITKED